MRAGAAAVGPPGRLDLTPAELAAVRVGTYRVRDGYELTVALGPTGATVRVPGQEPIALLAREDGSFALEGLAAVLQFNGPAPVVLRQGPEEEWELVRLP